MLKKSAKKRKEHSLVQAAREMLAHHRGEITLPSYTVAVPPKVDVASVRKGLGYSQKQFAEHFGFALSAVKEWEQGRRLPERSTRIYLSVIAINPKAVEQALAQL